MTLLSIFSSFFEIFSCFFFFSFFSRNLQRHPPEPTVPHVVADRRVDDRHSGTLSADDAGAATVPGPGARTRGAFSQ